MTSRAIPGPMPHRHQECVDAGNCNGRGWCYGQTCDVSQQPGGLRVATERCVTCRRRIRNRRAEVRTADVIAIDPCPHGYYHYCARCAARGTDPTVRYPEGFPR